MVTHHVPGRHHLLENYNLFLFECISLGRMGGLQDLRHGSYSDLLSFFLPKRVFFQQIFFLAAQLSLFIQLNY